MNKRLEKRHKRKVSRKSKRLRQSQPDVRTPEQLRAAREASRSITGRGNNFRSPYSAPVKPGAAS